MVIFLRPVSGVIQNGHEVIELVWKAIWPTIVPKHQLLSFVNIFKDSVPKILKQQRNARLLINPRLKVFMIQLKNFQKDVFQELTVHLPKLLYALDYHFKLSKIHFLWTFLKS